LIVVVVLARSDILVTPETVNDWVSANWEPLRDMPTMNGDLGQQQLDVFFERINNDAYLGVAGSAAIVRLAGMMGPRGFSAAANTLVKFGAISTTHEIAGRFGGKLVGTTKVLRGLGKLAGGVVLGCSIHETVDACRVHEAAWAARDQIGQHWNLIIENLNANVRYGQCCVCVRSQPQS
jgi:hypothetical protein